jgi:hypothetical protein
MSKELDPSLFGEGAWASPRAVEKSRSTAFDAVGHIEQKVADLRIQHREMKEEMGRFASEMEVFKTSTHNKMEKLAQQVARLEGLQGKVHQEVSTRMSQMHTRLADRQSVDIKVQEMVDRHQALIRSAEMRINQMQKILAEKEAMLLSAQVTLSEAKIEISRLKRM